MKRSLVLLPLLAGLLAIPSSGQALIPTYLGDAHLDGPNGTAGLGLFQSAPGQVSKMRLAKRLRFTVFGTSRGAGPDMIMISGCPGNRRFGVRYMAGSLDITPTMLAGYTTGPYGFNEGVAVKAIVTRKAATDRGDTWTCDFFVDSANSTSDDTVVAKIRAR